MILHREALQLLMQDAIRKPIIECRSLRKKFVAGWSMVLFEFFVIVGSEKRYDAHESDWKVEH